MSGKGAGMIALVRGGTTYRGSSRGAAAGGAAAAGVNWAAPADRVDAEPDIETLFVAGVVACGMRAESGPAVTCWISLPSPVRPS